MLRMLACDERLTWPPDPDGWETAEAVYWLGVRWHGGQSCPLYAAQCATEFSPGPIAQPSDDMLRTVSDLAALAFAHVRCRYCGKLAPSSDCESHL